MSEKQGLSSPSSVRASLPQYLLTDLVGALCMAKVRGSMFNSIMVWEKGKIVYTKYQESKSLTFHLAREGKENEDRLAITNKILIA